MKAQGLDAALRALAQPAGLILYPTSTVYGVGGRASDSRAARRLSELKGRPMQPQIVLVSAIPEGLPSRTVKLAERLWPGPFTLIVDCPQDLDIAPEILGPGGSLALRMVQHPVARQLVESLGPITSSSANLHGASPARDLSDCQLSVDARLDVGPLPPRSPSLLFDARTGKLLRGGSQEQRLHAIWAELQQETSE